MPPSTPSSEQPSQQPEAPVTDIQPVTAAPAPSYAPVVAEDPGKTMSIVGLVLAFVFPLVGIFLSIFGLKKSKAAGFSNTLAVVGIILNAVFMVIGLVIGGLILLATVAGVQEVAREKQAQQQQSMTSEHTAMTEMGKSIAAEIVQYIDDGMKSGETTYPTTLAQLSPGSSVTQSKSPLTAAPMDGNTIEFYACEKGNKVGYWDFGANKVVYLYTTDTTASSKCTLATS